jgi:hypothetical protein
MQATFLMLVTKILVLKLATFCETTAPGLLNMCRRFGGTGGIQLYDTLRMEAAGVLEEPAAPLHGTGVVKPGGGGTLHSLVKGKKF